MTMQVIHKTSQLQQRWDWDPVHLGRGAAQITAFELVVGTACYSQCANGKTPIDTNTHLLTKYTLNTHIHTHTDKHTHTQMNTK